jgi:inner membrane protein
MPTIISHAIVGAGLGTVLPGRHTSARILLLGASCSMLPDLDVVGLALGFHLDHLLGHRGLTHSLLFAAAVGAVTALAMRRAVPGVRASTLGIYALLATASHGVLDAFTNGGRGVAFFAPFSATRFHFPLQPIEVSPLSVREFLGARGPAILVNEAVWIWAPVLVITLAVFLWRRRSATAGADREEKAA